MASGACGNESDGSLSNSASGQDAGVCSRDLPAINDLLAHPVACVSDGQCPRGAFCDPSRGACDFQCVTDSACGPSGTCGCDGHCAGGTGPGPSGGSTCERSKALLQSASARTCTADAQCPVGMACDLVAHTCEIKATCTTDATCPSGATCPQTGATAHTCQAKTCAADTDCPAGIACDTSVNRCTVHTPRACVFDEQCPNGSRCDEATRQCRNDCTADTDCGAGQGCDCLGACVAPGTVPAIPTDRGARLEVSPNRATVIPLANGTSPWAPFRMTATVVAATVDAATIAKDADVYVRASSGLLVACGTALAPVATAYTNACSLSAAWTFAAVGGRQQAQQYVWVKPSAPTVVIGNITFSSNQVNGAPASVQIAPQVLAANEPAVNTPRAFTGDYEGTMTYLGTNWYAIVNGALVPDWDASSTNAPAPLPVSAVAFEKGTGERVVDFFDPAMTLSDNGKLRGSSTQVTYVDWSAVVDHQSGPGKDAVGMFQAKTVLVNNQFDGLSGSLRGVLVIVPRQGADPVAYQYELVQRAATTACGAGCAAGATCATDLGVCEAGPAWVNGYDYEHLPISEVRDLKDFVYNEWSAWLTATGTLAGGTTCNWRPCSSALVGADGAAKIMCSQSGDNSSSVFDTFTTAMPISGDLQCSDTHVPHGPDFLFDADRAAAPGSLVAATPSATMLAGCMRDLALRTNDAMFSSDPLIALRDGLAGRACLSPAHFYPALGKVVGYTSTDTTLKTAADKLAQRVLAQWLTIHGFVAKEGAQQAPMAAALAPANDLVTGEAAAISAAPSLDTILAQLERGWNLVLVGPRRQAVIDTTYLDPDYRPASAPAGDQDVALPVTILETAALHLDAVTTYLRRAQLTTYDSCRVAGSSSGQILALQTAGRALRYTTQAESLAAWSYERITTRVPKLNTSQKAAVCTTAPAGTPPLLGFPFCALDLTNPTALIPAWQARWDAARVQYDAARQRAMAAAVDVSTCANPVTVADANTASSTSVNPVPLFFGDVSGTSSRFFASSDYLLNGWAQPAVEHAKIALDAARVGWTEKRSSQTQQILTDQEADRRREQIGTGYGQQLVDACGLEGVPATSALARFTGANRLRPETCFLKSDSAECARYVSEATSTVPAGVVATGQISFAPTPIPEDTCPASRSDASVRQRLCMVQDQWSSLGRQDESLHAAAVAFKTVTIQREPECDRVVSVTLNGVVTQWSAIPSPGRGGASPASLGASEQWCRDQLNGATEDPPYFPDTNSYATCFRGQLGEQVLAAMGSRRNIQLALMEWWDAQKLFDIAATHCDHLKTWQISEADLTAWHSSYMNNLSLARGLVGGLARGVMQADPSELIGAMFGRQMALADQDYQRKMSKIQNEKELYTCYEEARKVKLRIDNAAVAIEGAIASGDQHLVAFHDLQSKVRNLVGDGNAALVREQGRTIPPIAFHYWLDEKIDKFHKDFEWAKSLTYLSMLAVEYEYQQSLGLRSAILSATHPDQLADAIRTMQQTQISRTINGRRPEDAKLVRSLANDILGLDDLKAARPGERTWTKLERFQRRLWSPEYAVYDSAGVYLGQGVPFTLEPEGELAYACAEKLWTVTATIQGDGLSELAPSAPLMVLKRNQFASQWCGGSGDGSQMQTASVQPVSSLFHPEDRGGTEAATQQYVTARIAPWFNVARTDLYREAYAEGASTELAGRGMYGDYVLLFPAEGLLKDGFALNKVEDVLLRFDYLSVDNLNVIARATSDSDDDQADDRGASE